MSAAEVLSWANCEGVALTVNGERLTWKSEHQPPSDLLGSIKQHRLEIVAILSAANVAPRLSLMTPEQLGWLGRVATMLNCPPQYLLDLKLIDSDDLAEQLEADPQKVAALIRSNPAWGAYQKRRKSLDYGEA
jgi:hypothetical protein